MKPKITRKQLRTKHQLETMLRRHGYRRDDRSDHREWMKYNSAFQVKIRLDQNNPDGFEGFQLMITTYMRWDISPRELEALVAFLKEEFSWN